MANSKTAGQVVVPNDSGKYKPATTGSDQKVMIKNVPDGAIGEAITLKFGSVELQTIRDPKAFAANVKAGQEALRRARDALATPGVKLRMPRSIPRYSADPSNPTLLIRELRGKRQSGRLVNGKFIVA